MTQEHEAREPQNRALSEETIRAGCDAYNEAMLKRLPARFAIEAAMKVAVAAAPSTAPSWSTALQIVQAGFRAWAEKPHNRRWFKRIDGTPIPNDLCVNIAEAVIAAMRVGPAADLCGEGRRSTPGDVEAVAAVIAEAVNMALAGVGAPGRLRAGDDGATYYAERALAALLPILSEDEGAPPLRASGLGSTSMRPTNTRGPSKDGGIR